MWQANIHNWTSPRPRFSWLQARRFATELSQQQFDDLIDLSTPFQLRNPTDSFKFATVKGSSIEEYFKRQVEFTTMYRTMEPQNKKTVEEAIKAVEDG